MPPPQPQPQMRSSFASSRQSRDSKGRKLKLSQRGDPEKRPILTRIYGMIGCLIVSLVLIVILIILQKKLPDGAGSYFHIPVRRDLAAISAREPAQRQEDGLKKKRATVVPRQLEPRITPIITIAPPIRLSFSTTPAPTPTPGANCISGTSYQVDCTSQEIIQRMAKRQKFDVQCSTTTLGDCPSRFIFTIEPIRFSETTSTPSMITPSPVWSSEIPINSCTTLLEGCTYILENVDIGSTYTCSSMLVTESDCYISTTPPPSTITPSPVWSSEIPINSCTTLLEGCTYTLENVDIGSTYTCSSTLVTESDCYITTTTPPSSTITPAPVWASEIPINSCTTLLEGCTYTLENVDFGSTYTCISTLVTKSDCYVTTTTPPPSTITPSPVWASEIPINSCTTLLEGCTYHLARGSVGSAYTCISTMVTKSDCYITTTTPPPSSVTGPPLTIITINPCTYIAEGCTTITNDAGPPVPTCYDTTVSRRGCRISTAPPPTSMSSNSCVATSTSCTTTGDIDIGFVVSCSDSYSTISGCGSISTSNSSTTTPASSSSTTPSSSSSTVSSTDPPTSSSSSTVPTNSSSLSPSSSSSSVSSTTPPLSISSAASSSSGSVSVVVGAVIITTNSSSSSTSSAAGSSSSSGSVLVGPISITTNSSSSSSVSTSFSSPSTGPSSSLPTFSSRSPVTVGRPVSLSSSSTTISPSASTPTVIVSGRPSISTGPISTTASGTPSASSSAPPILVVALPSGSTSSLTSKSTSASSPPASPSLSFPPVSGSTSPSPVSIVSGTPPSLSSPSGSSSPLPLIAALKLPSSIPSPTTPNFTPSTLATLPSGSSLPSASIPTGSGTTVSGSPTSSPATASSDLLQSIISGSLAPSKTAAGGGGGGGGGGSPSQTDDPKKFHAIPDIWPITQTILGDYTPLVVSRGFLMLLKAFYEQLLTWEPIRQLLTPGGGSLVDSSVLTPIRIAIISAHIGTAFSAGLTFFDTGYCSSTQLDAIGICPPRLSVNPPIVDVVIVTLIIQVLTIIYVISQWWKKPGGFSADPTSVAGIAAFMGHPEIEQEFVAIPTEITYAGLKKRLKGKKFRLGQFATERGIVKYGIMPVDDEGTGPRKKDDGFFSKIKNGWSNFSGKFTFLHNWKRNRHMFDIVFVMFLIALLGLTIDAVSRINRSQVVFLATASVHGTGWRIFTTIMGVIVSYFWGQFFQDAQTFAPYIDLAKGSSDPGSTILLRRHSIPLTAFFPLLWHCHYTPAMVAFIGLIAEILIVALSGLPYRPGQSRGEFLFWGVTSLAILTIMITMLIAVFFWRRKLPHLPRAPESIAAVMTYVAGTSMTRDFNGLEQLKRKERDQAIKDLEKTYAYWWRREEDGRVRWVVDVVPGEKNNRALMDGANDFS